MNRLFVAIEFPSAVRDRLRLLCHGLPDTRWTDPAQFHLTVRFIGELEGGQVQDVREALATVMAEPFELMLMGVGHFPPRGRPRVIWTGADGGDGLLALHHKINRALDEIGLPPEGRKYMPHVTLGRLDGTPAKRVAGYMSQFGAFSVPPFAIDRFTLFDSRLTGSGAIHRKLARYHLT